jgi:hypothetical protein
MELEKVQQAEDACWTGRDGILRPVIALLFVAGVILDAGSPGEVSMMLIAAGFIGGYMAMGIGANNVAPAVGSSAPALMGAIGIVLGLELYGTRLIRTVGPES